MRGPREIPRSFLTIYLDKIDINGAGGRVTVVGCPRFGGFRCPSVCPWCVARDRWHRAWPAAQTSLCAGFAARSIAPCVARSLFLIAQTSLCAVFAAISAKTRQNLAVGGLCGLSCFRPSFRIVLADVCGPECRQTSLCAVFAKIAFSPTRNTKSNTQNRPLSNDMLYFILLKNTCSRLRETLL